MTAPWLARKDWAERRVRDERYKLAGCMVRGGLFLFVGSCGFAWVFLKDGGADNLPVLLFPTFVAALVGAALYGRRHQEKFGTPILELESVPVVPGGMLAGYVRSTADLAPPEGFVIRLRCLHKRETGSGKNKRTDTTTLWEQEMTLPAAAERPDGLALPVAFALPPDARETDERNSANKVVWELSVKATLPGVDFSAVFDIPVFEPGGRRDG